MGLYNLHSAFGDRYERQCSGLQWLVSKCALSSGVEAVGWVSVVIRYEELALVSSGGDKAVSDSVLLGRQSVGRG